MEHVPGKSIPQRRMVIKMIVQNSNSIQEISTKWRHVGYLKLLQISLFQESSKQNIGCDTRNHEIASNIYDKIVLLESYTSGKKKEESLKFKKGNGYKTTLSQVGMKKIQC